MAEPWPLDRVAALLAARERRILDLPNARRAAVLVGVTLDDRPRVLYTVRTVSLTTHAGQVSFPGGSLEGGETLPQAALREAWEEVGVEPRGVRLLGLLDDVWTPAGFHVTPVVAALPPVFDIKPSAGEVAEVLLVPIDELQGIEIAWEERRVPTAEGYGLSVVRRVPHMPWRHVNIWGMTGLVTVNLLEVWRQSATPAP